MKTLKEYIEESILDVDDLVADDTKFIEKWLKDHCMIIGTYTIKNNIIDVNGTVSIDEDVRTIDVQFGTVIGNFRCSRCRQLSSLKGSPKKVGKDFDCAGCIHLLTLEGAPKEVKGSVFCNSCPKLTSLEGAPKKVGGNFYCCYNDSLTSLKGAPKEIGGIFNCQFCKQLTSLKYTPKAKEIEADIIESILDIDDLIKDDSIYIKDWLKKNCEIKGSYTIKNGVVNVNGDVALNYNVESIGVQFGKVTGYFKCDSCGRLKSLEGSPKEVGDDFDCTYCNSLTSLKGAPEKVGRDFVCTGCDSLITLEGSPKVVKRDFYCAYCDSLTSLKGISKHVGGEIFHDLVDVK